MRIDPRKLELALARRCMTMRDLRENGAAAATIAKINAGENLRPISAGRIAKALDVDVAEIIKED